MPIYQWKDKVTGKPIEILRNFDEYLKEPTKEELLAAGFTEEEIEKIDLIKLVGSGIRVTRGDNWTGSKGNW